MDRARLADRIIWAAPRAPFQRFYSLLNTFSLLGMNVGSGIQSHESNGERHVLTAIAEYYSMSDRPVVVFDVGANAGQYASMIDEILGDRAVLYSFEPDPVTFESLNRNLGHLPNFRSFNLALGRADTSLSFYVNRSNTALSSLCQPRLPGQAEHSLESLTAQVRRIDSLRVDLGIEHIDILKVDVEGGELAVLEGAAELLESQEVDFIQFEFGERNIDSRTFFADFYRLLTPGYRLYRILPRHLERIRQYKTSYEIFVSESHYMAVSEAIASNPRVSWRW